MQTGKRIRYAVLLLLVTLSFLLSGCRREMIQPLDSPAVRSDEQAAEGEELLTMTETREEAEAIAEQYDITLVAWEQKIATFHTEENPEEVIRRGQKHGWHELEINWVYQLDDPIPEQRSGS